MAADRVFSLVQSWLEAGPAIAHYNNNQEIDGAAPAGSARMNAAMA